MIHLQNNFLVLYLTISMYGNYVLHRLMTNFSGLTIE